MAKTRSPLMAKRRSGPSANTQLCIHVKTEHCHVKDCENPVLMVENVNGKTKRRCAQHLNNSKPVTNPTIAAEMWWLN